MINNYPPKVLISLLLMHTALIIAYGQEKIGSKFGKGLQFVAADSSFYLKFGTRIQTLYQGELNLDNDNYDDNILIRRARLKFEGFAYTPNLTYKLELGLSNRDTGGAIPENNNTANILLDAFVKWNFYKNWSLWVGQAKLPGNRERLVSSQKLQFVDRSNVNSRFNIDRGTGIQLHHELTLNNSEVILKKAFSFSMGEGRDITADNKGGYEYTVRFDLLPLGDFDELTITDLNRVEEPKLAFGATYDFNDGASRQRGGLGSFTGTENDLRTWFIDALLKYKGFSTYLEYANKNAPDGPVTFNGEGEPVSYFTGTGFNWQAGYLFKNNIEIAGRFTTVDPDPETGFNDNDQYTLGLSKYIKGHNLKVQGDISFIEEDNSEDHLMFRLQMELAL